VLANRPVGAKHVKKLLGEKSFGGKAAAVCSGGFITEKRGENII